MVNSRCPSERALSKATRSAQVVSPYVAFSTLQPRTISPLAVSSAAPTRNPEYVAIARSRATRAAATSASEPANDTLQQCDEDAANPLRRFHHFIMMQRLIDDAGSHVGDARHSQHLYPHLPGHDRLGRRGHSNRIR